MRMSFGEFLVSFWTEYKIIEVTLHKDEWHKET